MNDYVSLLLGESWKTLLEQTFKEWGFLVVKCLILNNRFWGSRFRPISPNLLP